MAHDVFVSYSSKNADTAVAVCTALEANGVKCWMAPRDILPGASWASSIIDAINSSRALLLIFTEESNRSHQVIREIERAVSKRMLIIPFRVQEVALSQEMEYFISAAHWLNASDSPLAQHVEKLGTQVRELLDSEAARARRPAQRQRESSHTGRWIAAGAVAVMLAVGVGTSLWKSSQNLSPPGPDPVKVGKTGGPTRPLRPSFYTVFAEIFSPPQPQTDRIVGDLEKNADLFVAQVNQTIIDRSEPVMVSAQDDLVADDHLPPVLSTAWKTRRAEVLANVAAGPERPQALFRALVDLRISLNRVNRSFPSTGKVVGRVTARQWQRELADELALIREQRMRDALTRLPASGAGEPAIWQSVTALYADSLAHFDDLHNRYTQLEDLLDAYAAHTGDDHASQLAAIEALTKASEADHDPTTANILDPIGNRAAALLAVRSADRPRLESLLADSSSGKEVIWAAWRRLDDRALSPWPTSVPEFQVEIDAQKRLRAGANPSAAAELDATGTRRWNSAIAHLAPEQVVSATHFFLEKVVPGNCVLSDHVDDWFRYNVLLTNLWQASVDENAVTAAVTEFRDGVDRLNPLVSTDPRLKVFRTALDTPFDSAAFTGQGPERADWKLKPTMTGHDDTVVYYGPTDPISGVPPLIEFRRVTPSGAKARPFFLSSTEVSLKLAMTVLNAAPELRQLLGAAGKKFDSRVQVWCIKTGGLVEQHNGWLTRSDIVTPPADSPQDYPMQAIPPEAAIGIARSLGCRLPTTDEWRAAVAVEQDDWAKRYRQKRPLGWKLRDARWSNRGPASERFTLETGIFVPADDQDRMGLISTSDSVWLEQGLDGATAGSQRTSSALGGAKPGEPIHDEQLFMNDDRSVAFRKVALGSFVPLYSGFHDLVGNVAEYTMESPLAFASLPTHCSARELQEFTGRHKDELHVIGGSAFSPPFVDYSQPYPVKPELSTEGFADVGFRLAYSEVSEPHVAWLHGALEKSMYLTADAVSQASAK